MNKRNILAVILFLLLIGDFTYSFFQFYYTPLDGDMASTIVPSRDIKEVLNDPFGINVLIKNTPHINPNRFFAHYSLKSYFSSVPFIVQKFTNPIESVYLSTAIIKLLIQIVIVYLLSSIISQKKSIFNLKFLVAAAIITPLFQTYGYNNYMGIIDKSITYTFFYALPIALLLIFIYPFYFKIYQADKFKLTLLIKMFLILLIVVLPFSGALIPPVILISAILIIIYYIRSNYQKPKKSSIIKELDAMLKCFPKEFLLFYTPISIISLYSVFLGFYNSQFSTEILPIYERYLRLPEGIYYLFTQKPGYLLLFLLITINLFIIKNINRSKGNAKIFSSFKWIAIFSTTYILLLPLGGYKEYRENIIRYDTFMPITICLIYIYGISSYFIIRKIKKSKNLYIALIIIFAIMFTNADISELNKNVCERNALKQISNSKEKVVLIKSDCKVLSWELINEQKYSNLNAELIKFWNITQEKKLYYNKAIGLK